MATILFSIQSIAQQYVEILREIIGIDCSILDDQQYRVAGSGRMKERRGSMAAYGNIMKHAIETGEIVVVTDPVKNPLCAGCPSRDHCDNLCEVWAPILMEGKAIGVIGCVCYDEAQKNSFLEQEQVFRQFFLQFAGLVSAQAEAIVWGDRQKSVQRLLEDILGLAQVGILILDSRNKVYNINDTGRELLWLGKQVPSSSITVSSCVDPEKKEYLLSFGEQNRSVIAETYHVGMDPYDRLMVFGIAELRSDFLDDILSLRPGSELDRIIGNSGPILRLKKNIRLVAPSTSNILVTGESGTGKELAARAIHGESLRKDGPFVAVNCAALPENLLESELFGYVKGAFTGASASGKKGLLETAQGGTFFLDEVGDMPPAIQVKLLRVLEQREITRLGSNIPIPIDVRFVFATNRDLKEMVREKTFREDLFYRINVIPLTLPPLRERPGDIRLIAESFIRKFTRAMQRQCSGVSKDFWDTLERHDWPGNVRELQNIIEYAVNLLPSSGILRSELLRNRLAPPAGRGELAALPLGEDWNLEHMEESMIRQCLAKNAGKKEEKRITAQELGISLATLYRKMKQYGL